MKLFLEVVPVEEAVAAVRRIAPPVVEETVPLEEAYGRVLARDISAGEDIPGFTRSVKDGYAVVAADTTGAGEAMPAMLENTGRVAMGAAEARAIAPGQCCYVPTGGVIPPGADAIVMVEYTEAVGDEVLVHRPVAPGENLIARGEDFAAGAVVLEAGRRCSPRDLGVLAALGVAEVPVAARPRVGIISTGNELVPVAATPGPAQVRDANTSLASGFVIERGGEPVRYGIVRDERAALEEALAAAAAECDAVLLSGGSSKDERDMCAAVIADAGEVLIHGVAIAPGKPTIVGRVGPAPVIGLPGHPASTCVVLIVVAGPLLAAMTGERRAVRTATARLTQNVPSERGRDDYVRVALDGEGGAAPLFGKSGLLNTLVASSGVVRVPASREGLETGEEVEVLLW
ncbi:MAG: molybdopterin molybdotransferase MoeA [Methanomicrobiaceae archaeon]|nr:molybdopterin molybdotransferase MoeA [Methanomicrobiaceae archaeon]